jgi:hypothetical protein
LQVASTNDYLLHITFKDITTKVVGYTRTGKYGRTLLFPFSEDLTERVPGDTILHLAVRNNKPSAVTKLLSLGCSATEANDVGESPVELAKHLQDSGENPHMNRLFQGIAIELPTVRT